MAGFEYEVNEEMDHVFDEKGNSFLALREVKWGQGDFKLEIRKWFVNASGEETIGKGATFLTEEGPHDLTKVLIENNFGYTQDIVNAVAGRDDFQECLDNYNNGYSDSKDGMYDPSESLF